MGQALNKLAGDIAERVRKRIYCLFYGEYLPVCSLKIAMNIF